MPCNVRRITLCWVLPLLTLILSEVRANSTATPCGPLTGPPKQPHMRVAFISQDFRNESIASVYRGMEEAAQLMSWQLKLYNGNGVPETITSILRAQSPEQIDGLVLGGIGADRKLKAALAHLLPQTVIVGWHASPVTGADNYLFMNVTTAPRAVAQMAVSVVASSRTSELAGVILINDPRFEIANVKTAHLKEGLQACSTCRLLSVENIAISEADVLMPKRLSAWQAAYGSRWTHTIAINDTYFDNVHWPLSQLGRRDVQNIAAGDGSLQAIARVRSGRSSQIATIAEPLTAQGWQLVDELNRAFAKQPPSEYVAEPIMIRTGTAAQTDLPSPLDPDCFKSQYRSIWQIGN